MNYDQETKHIFEKVFARHKDNPASWAFTAWNLRTAADVLFDAYRNSASPDGEPINQENEKLDSPATMLYGFALENLIKGYLIKKHGGFENAITANNNAWQHHRLPTLATATGLNPTSEQLLLLGSLQEFARWAGRYPISNKAEQFTLPRQLNAGGNMTPCEIQSDGLNVLEPFYKQLNDAIFENPRNALSQGV